MLESSDCLIIVVIVLLQANYVCSFTTISKVKSYSLVMKSVKQSHQQQFMAVSIKLMMQMISLMLA